jgi:hypothetical protein
MDALKIGQQQRIDAEEERIRTSQAFKDALKLIDPASERVTECERRLLDCIFRVNMFQHLDKWPTPAEMREVLEKLIENLRKLEKDRLLSGAFRDQARLELERIERLAKREVPPGSRRPSDVKLNSVCFANDLLAEFGKGAPGLTRDGNWHTLAVMLFGGNSETDLFEYMRLCRSLPARRSYDMAIPEWKAALVPKS